MNYRRIKRASDVLLSAVALALLAPLMLLLALAIAIDSKGPVFFRQLRVGQYGRTFRILKFRTMVVDAPKMGAAITSRNDKRITRLGRVLRNTKLDELPQFLNVLIGDMSLVGPRPEVPEYVKFYTPAQRNLMLSVRPGLTDYASLLFHDENSLISEALDPVETYRTHIMPLKFKYYSKYCERLSFVTDAEIIVATIALVVFGAMPKKLREDQDLRSIVNTLR